MSYSITDYFSNMYLADSSGAAWPRIHSCLELTERVQRLGFLPLLESGIAGYAAESMMDDDCRYTQFEDGSWEWPLWTWKGSVIREGGCVYGKFFAGKAGFVSLDWWPDLCNWRRSRNPLPEEGSIESIVLDTLREHGSMVARDLRRLCNFTGKNMRSKFDGYINRLQMATRIVTEDFVYPVDKHGREYGFGWSLLTTPEVMFGHDACTCQRSPEASFQRMSEHLKAILPWATEQQIKRLLR